MLNTNTDVLAIASDKPHVGELLSEYNRAMINSSQGNLVTKFDNIRFCRWPGQTDDGKKHSENRSEGDEAWPFEGASDVRARLIDATCNELTALLVGAFQKSELRANGNELSDMPVSQIGTTLLRWIRDCKMPQQLYKEATLAAQYALQYGWSAFFVGWQQNISKRTQEISMEQIMGLAQQSNNEFIAELPKLILLFQEKAVEVILGVIPGITRTDAKRMVKELAETGKTTMDEEYVSKNLPEIVALKPWDEIIFPPETADLQRSRVIFRRTWMSEVELREKITTEGWNPDWVERALQQLGKSSSYYNINLLPTTTMMVYNGVNYMNMVEVVYCYTKSLDGNAPAIFYTVICPQAASNRQSDGDSWAIHERLDYAHGEYPFVEFRREQIRRAITDTRGIPELATTDQDEIKAQHDSIRDHTAFSTLPPIKVVKRVGAINKIGPGVSLPVTNQNDYTFMEPPAREPTVAFNLIQRVEQQHAAYFGTNNGLVSPMTTQMLQQALVNSWLLSWRSVFRQMFSLCCQYMPPEEIQRITGGQLPSNLSEIHNEFDINVRFDVMNMDKEYIAQKVDFLTKIKQMDSGGVLNANRITEMLIQAIAPEMAGELIMNQEQASQKMFKDVQTDIGMMLLGNEALYQENDPAAQTKMQFAQQVMQNNPKAQQALQADQNFQALFQNYVKNLQMSVMQQQNAQIGRLGVTPMQQQPGQ
ncbi:hypothetical protein UFOVP298_41 [uncultured Caudovirales phage]|uniref:Portal protein n=1 Tax=uncultured Caudovirales phage TaxID=2100421 RepID=A0A6J5MVC8_9CAUD|nr:hypothetical protein UFOVP298_41 [uncultured Caudovirales phage]CAB4150884.1 hypothetical protein UFOVP572_50 [uncultured Caudovirales phage]